MNPLVKPNFSNRYEATNESKSSGATYTPKTLADFVAKRILEVAEAILNKPCIRILDPAIGDGELLVSILQQIGVRDGIEVYGFDTASEAVATAAERLKRLFPHVLIRLQQTNFLEYVSDHFDVRGTHRMFGDEVPDSFDLIIANPPYVRTQILGTRQAQLLAKQFGLTGRVDLYYAFLVAMATVLDPQGVAGIIVSNRFMTTKSGGAVRTAIQEGFNIHSVWDLGDTKLFSAAVLPAVLLVQGKFSKVLESPKFTSIYETTEAVEMEADGPISALSRNGVVALPNGRRYKVRHGKLDMSGGLGSVWRIATTTGDAWLTTVEANTWRTFRDIGKIRVGVKTCADKIFIRSDWDSFPKNERPELIRSLTTHYIARRFKALELNQQKILYPHESVQGQRQTIDLDQYPRTRAYLERYRATLEGRKYVIEAGRKWFEIWVPQDPALWNLPKLVFRDISEKPVFWIDQQQTVVNGDCYWLVTEEGSQDLLWLAAAVANSTFAEAFYDHRFHNKLYSGRRRFITQYVEKFPLPDPNSEIGQEIIDTAKAIYDVIDLPHAADLEHKLNALVWQAFGLSSEKISG